MWGRVRVCYKGDIWGYNGIMEKKMETTKILSGYSHCVKASQE